MKFPGANYFGPGRKNPYVTELGKMLIGRGAKKFYAVGPGPFWGEADKNATRAFQLAQGWTGLNADGIPGHRTWDLLVTGKGKNIPSDAKAATMPDNTFPGASKFGPGKSNEYITRLGKMLVARGGSRFYKEGPGPTWGNADHNATQAFQLAQGWTGSSADGIPGPTTWDYLVNGKGKNIPSSGGGSRVNSPVPGYGINYPYGVKNSRYSAGYHTGNDYAAPVGTPVVAVRNGTVVWSNSNGGAYGNWIGLLGDNGRVYVYCHLSTRSVKAGQKVSAGQQLGKVGATGNVTGPHLHFEMSKTSTWSYGNVQKPTW